MMSAWVNIVLTFPRYFLIIGLTVLTAAFFSDNIRAMGPNMDFELVLPMALGRFVPVGLLGFLIAGLLAAFMSNFAATVNAAPPYFVNDIYKRYIRPDAPPKTYVRLSYISSFAVVVIGVLIGWNVTSVNSVVLWIVSGLWGGYTASNVLKWYWWRFNGYGYFWGMVTGMAGSLITFAFPNVHPLNLFPIIVGLALIGCIVGTLRTKPEEDAVLMDFYKRVNPWGFWGPIREKVMREDPSFKPNPDFARDMFNIVVGIAWQTSLIAFPVYIVIRRYEIAAWAIAVVVVTSITLKFTWYDHLKKMEIAPA